MSARQHETRAQPVTRPEWRKIPLPGPLWSALAATVLLLFTVGAGIGIRHYHERQLIARLERLRAQCRTTIVAPDWLRGLVDDRWLTPFERITEVLFNCETPPDLNLADEDLSFLADLSKLEHLSLNRTRVTDDALIHLERLRSLKILRLVDTDVTDDGVEHVLKLRQLEELDLYRTQITSEGVDRVKTLPNLKYLRAPNESYRRYLPPRSR
jgi:Leucine Rich repeat